MTNIQEILDKIGNSKITNDRYVRGVTTRKFIKKFYVFRNGVLIDTIEGRDNVVKKYGISSCRLYRGIETEGLYFSLDGKYNPKKVQPKAGKFYSYSVYEDDILVKTFSSRTECAKFLGCCEQNIWRSLKEKRKIKDRYTIKKIT